MILSETPACYAHAQNVLMLHVGPGNLRLFGTFVPIRTPSGTLVQIRIQLRLFRLSTFPFVLFRHASIRRLCLFLVVLSQRTAGLKRQRAHPRNHLVNLD